MADHILQVTGKRWKWLPWFKHTVFVTFSEDVTWREVEWIAHDMSQNGFQVIVYKPEDRDKYEE